MVLTNGLERTASESQEVIKNLNNNGEDDIPLNKLEKRNKKQEKEDIEKTKRHNRRPAPQNNSGIET